MSADVGTSIPEAVVREHVAHLVDLMRGGDLARGGNLAPGGDFVGGGDLEPIPVGRTTQPRAAVPHGYRDGLLVRGEELAAVLVFHASNMLAFTGTSHAASDRLTCGLVTREGSVHVICPAFERPAVAAAEGIAAIHTWEEHEDPYRLCARVLGEAGVRGGVVGVDGRTWVDAQQRFAEAMGPGIRLRAAEAMLREVRICKTAAEQEVLRAAHRRGERLYFELGRVMRPGVSEIELYRHLAAKFACEGWRGDEASTVSGAAGRGEKTGQRPMLPDSVPNDEGMAVDPMIQSGPNGAVPHNLTGARVLRDGDLVVVDSVVTHQGYKNDLTRTYAIGPPSHKAKEVYRLVREAHDAAIAAARPGVECQELDQIARDVIAKGGFGECFLHRLGHGIGIEGHEPPYLVGGNAEKLRPGMCVTVEPGIYIRGEFGVRIEDDILITETGCEVIRGELRTDVTDAFER